MKGDNQNIVTQEDIEQVNNIEKEGKDNILISIIMVVAILLIVGLVIFFIQNQKKKSRYTYVDENGEKREFTLDFTEDDLEEVYEELSKIPME